MSKLSKYRSKIKIKYGDQFFDKYADETDYRVLKRIYLMGGTPGEETQKSPQSQPNHIEKIKNYNGDPDDPLSLDKQKNYIHTMLDGYHCAGKNNWKLYNNNKIYNSENGCISGNYNDAMKNLLLRSKKISDSIGVDKKYDGTYLHYIIRSPQIDVVPGDEVLTILMRAIDVKDSERKTPISAIDEKINNIISESNKKIFLMELKKKLKELRAQTKKKSLFPW